MLNLVPGWIFRVSLFFCLKQAENAGLLVQVLQEPFRVEKYRFGAFCYFPGVDLEFVSLDNPEPAAPGVSYRQI